MAVNSDVRGVSFLLPGGTRSRVEDLYLCDHCSILLSRYDLLDEFDSFYCMQCLENMPSTEAMAYGNRCPKCFDCPRCFHALQVMSKAVAESDSPDEPQKSPGSDTSGILFQFFCEYCSWDSSQLGLVAKRPDNLPTLAIQRERDSVHRKEATRLVDALRRSIHGFHKSSVSRQKLTASGGGRVVPAPPTRQWKGYQTSDVHVMDNLPFLRNGDATVGAAQNVALESPRRSRLESLEELHAAKEMFARKHNIWDFRHVEHETDVVDKKGEDAVKKEAPAVALRHYVTLSEVLHSEDMIEEMEKLKKLIDSTDEPESYASLEQKLRMPNASTAHLEHLMPTRKPLLTKRSHRCNKCQRLVLRAHINPTASTVKEKNNSALCYVPKIRIEGFSPKGEAEKFSRAKTAFKPLGLSCNSLCHVEFSNYGYEKVTVTFTANADRLTRTNHDTLTVLQPNFSFSIPPLDEMLEAEDVLSQKAEYKPQIGDPACVVFRNNHVAVIRLELRPIEGITANDCATFSLELDIVVGKQTIPICPVFLLGTFNG